MELSYGLILINGTYKICPTEKGNKKDLKVGPCYTITSANIT